MKKQTLLMLLLCFTIIEVQAQWNRTGTNTYLEYEGDKIGIGTPMPIFKLHTIGDIYADGGWFRVSGNKGLYFQDHGGGLHMSDDTWIRTAGNKSFYHNAGIMRTDGIFQVASSGGRFIVKETGNVGINNTNPPSKLALGAYTNTNVEDKGMTLGSDQNTIELIHSNYGSGYGSKIYGTDEGNGKTGLRFAVRGNSTDWNDVIYLTASDDNAGGNGNVGIGTTSPSQKLDIVGNAEINGSLYMTDHDLLEVRAIQLKDWDDNTGGTDNKYRLLARDGAFMFHNGGVVVGNYSNNTWEDLDDGTLVVEGKVGIGTTNPDQKLQIDNGSFLINLPLQTNNGINFRDINGSAGIYGDWGIQYWSPGVEGKPAGLNFWKPWGNTAQNEQEGISDNYILFLQDNGKVQIGDIETPGNYKLYVKDGILTEKVKVAVSGSINWADFVFEDNYQLKPLSEVESFIKENKHLPGVPSAEEVVKEGIDMAQMDAKLLEKIEELTLYMIEIKKEVEILKKENILLKSEIFQHK